MAKRVSKPVKRKGYQAGGLIDDDLSAMLRRTPNPYDPETSKRYVAARNAITSAQYNEMTPKQQEAYRNAFKDMPSVVSPSGKFDSGRSLELGRADYAGFAKGGKVKKVAPARKKGKR